MLHNALSSLSTDPDQLVHEQKTNIRGGRSSTTSLCTCTSEQLPDQTSSCRFSAQIQTQFVQQIAINFDFVLNCKFFVMQAVHCGIIQSSRQTLQLNIDTTTVQWGTKVEMVAMQKIITTMRSTRVLHLPIRSEAGLGHLRARKPNSHLRLFALLVHYAFPFSLFALHLRLFRGAVPEM